MLGHWRTMACMPWQVSVWKVCCLKARCTNRPHVSSCCARQWACSCPVSHLCSTLDKGLKSSRFPFHCSGPFVSLLLGRRTIPRGCRRGTAGLLGTCIRGACVRLCSSQPNSSPNQLLTRNSGGQFITCELPSHQFGPLLPGLFGFLCRFCASFASPRPLRLLPPPVLLPL